jgi:hypothetical protein
MFSDEWEDMVEHQIIRQVIDTPMGIAHKVTCTCGRQIVLTSSLVISYQRAEAHLAAAPTTRR